MVGCGNGILRGVRNDNTKMCDDNAENTTHPLVLRRRIKLWRDKPLKREINAIIVIINN